MSSARLAAQQEESAGRRGTLLQIDVSKLFVGKINVRKRPGDISDLLQSVKEKGVLEPVLARPAGSRYELVVGSRRFEAARAAHLKKIPAVVKAMTDEEAFIVSLMENIQRRDLEPEEEYDALMKLRKLNPRLYGSADQLARAIGKSRRYVEDRIHAVETVRSLRHETDADIRVKHAPTPEERREGVLPLKHATFLSRAEDAPAVQKLSSERRGEKLKQLAETIAPLPQPEAEKVVEHFVMAPRRPMEDIKREAILLHSVKLELLLDPRVADALRRAAEDRGTTMEAVASLAIHSWLRQQRYS